MDLPVIGAHCAVQTCNELDLLPIKCHCDKLFCRHHFLPDSHDCLAQLSQQHAAQPWVNRQRCALEGCGKLSLESVISKSDDQSDRVGATCARCTLSFCAAHRYPDSHSCPVPEPDKPMKNEAAHALLAKNFPAGSSQALLSAGPRRVKVLTTNPAKLAQIKRVDLMKMRQRALPGDPKAANVGLSDRVYFSVKVEGSAVAEKAFWFRKTIGTGRGLDHLALHLGAVSSDTQPLSLVKLSGEDLQERTVLRNDRPISEEVDEGDHLLISRRDPSPS